MRLVVLLGCSEDADAAVLRELAVQEKEYSGKNNFLLLLSGNRFDHCALALPLSR
jgi:hypothetical protein